MAKKKPTALTKSTKKLTSKGPIPKEGKPELQASFSLTFEVTKDRKFTVSMDDITNIVDTGLHLRLPPDDELSLGQFKDFYSWLSKEFQLNLPNLSEVAVVDQFLSGEIIIMRFEVKTPGIKEKSQKYDIAVKITFKNPIGIVGTLKLNEVEFAVTYEKKSQ